MDRLSCALVGAFAVTMAAAPAFAQTAESQPVAEPAAPAEGMIRIPVTTPVEFEFLTLINSKTSKIDEMFPIRLTKPILVDGQPVVPAGTMGEGQVVHAAKSGFGGKPGELIVTVRYLDYQGARIPLRRFRMGGLGIGEDRGGEAFGVSMVVPLAGFFMSGGEKTIPTGTHANAIVSADTDVPSPAPAPEAAPAPAPASN